MRPRTVRSVRSEVTTNNEAGYPGGADGIRARSYRRLGLANRHVPRAGLPRPDRRALPGSAVGAGSSVASNAVSMQ
jgi:hypothetical protein